MDAITYGELILTLGDTKLSVLELAVSEDPGQHGRLSADAAAQEGEKDYLLYEEGGDVSVYAIQGEERTPLFFGIVTKMKIRTVGRQCVVHLEAVTQSYQMDLATWNRTYQDTALTSYQMLELIIEPYWPFAQILASIPEEELGHIVVQYQETDWAFLNRILSAYGASACVDSTSPGICIRAGLMDISEETDWDSLPYTVSRNTAPVNADCPLKGQICYTVEAYEIVPLGEMVTFHGLELYIGKIERSIRKGLLVNRYSLYFEEGMEVSRYFNPFLSGVSINGIVTAVKRDTLLAWMETDALMLCQRKYFFPFSTVAASPDGSGWYCMPRRGDCVRIFFPTDDERDGYAIANLHAESKPASGSPIENPDMKDITMPDGKSVRFIAGGIQLSVGEDKGTVTLTNDGRAEIRTDESIDIGAAEGLYFTTEGEMTIKAGTQIQITSNSGASICLTQDTAKISANTICNN